MFQRMNFFGQSDEDSGFGRKCYETDCQWDVERAEGLHAGRKLAP